MPKDKLVEQLERYRDEQRAQRAARRRAVRHGAEGDYRRGPTEVPTMADDREPVAAPVKPEPRDWWDSPEDDEPNPVPPPPGLAEPEPEPAAVEEDEPELAPAGRHAAPPTLTRREEIGDRVRTGVRGIGQTLISFGIVVLLFVAYELWITDLFNQHEQGKLQDTLAQQWGSGTDPADAGGEDQATVGEPDDKVRDIPLGSGIALIRIPALGLDYVRAVVEGTSEASLAEGPGHYVDSVLPGQVGNFAVAGHRVGKGSPFLDLDRLKAGQAIVIETKSYYFIYRVLGDAKTGNPEVKDKQGIPGREIVDPTDVSVVAGVPDHPGLVPQRRMLTLTTCHPRFSARQRMIIHAELDGAPWPKSKGLPPVLKGVGT